MAEHQSRGMGVGLESLTFHGIDFPHPGAATGMDPLLLVLGISKGAKRIPSHASISSEDVEILIISEEQLSSVMVGSRFFYFKDYPK